jgi:hypothetical protein
LGALLISHGFTVERVADSFGPQCARY